MNFSKLTCSSLLALAVFLSLGTNKAICAATATVLDHQEEDDGTFKGGDLYDKNSKLRGNEKVRSANRILSSTDDDYFRTRYIDEIFFITTHNSLSLPGEVFSPNQNYGLKTQFNDGIRGFNFDLYPEGCCEINTSHGLGTIWKYNPEDQIKELIGALDEKPKEFIVIQLQSGPLESKHYELLATWFGPRLIKNFDPDTILGDYIDRGEKVLIVTDDGTDYDASIGIHNTEDIICENDYKYKNYFESPPFEYRRGPKHGETNKRFLRAMNYFYQIGHMAAAYRLHDTERALGYISEFEQQSYTGGVINTLLVDYYTQGDSARGEYEIFIIQDVMRKAGSSGFSEGDACYYTWDDLCEGDLECGKRSKEDETYVCCKDTYVPFGWITDVCGNGLKRGEECPSTRDGDCIGDLECGKRSEDDDTYICCNQTYVHWEGWFSFVDICK